MGGDTPKVLESAEAALDDIASFVGLAVVPEGLFAAGFARNDDPYFPAFEKGAKRIRIVALVSNEFLDARDQADAFLRHDAIGGVARREDQHPRPEILIDDRMDFAVAAAFRAPDRLKFWPPFPPLAQRWALTWGLSNATCSGGADGVATIANIFCQIPRSLQRAKRL